jgi:hypothetical protein
VRRPVVGMEFVASGSPLSPPDPHALAPEREERGPMP